MSANLWSCLVQRCTQRESAGRIVTELSRPKSTREARHQAASQPRILRGDSRPWSTCIPHRHEGLRSRHHPPAMPTVSFQWTRVTHQLRHLHVVRDDCPSFMICFSISGKTEPATARSSADRTCGGCVQVNPHDSSAFALRGVAR